MVAEVARHRGKKVHLRFSQLLDLKYTFYVLSRCVYVLDYLICLLQSKYQTILVLVPFVWQPQILFKLRQWIRFLTMFKKETNQWTIFLIFLDAHKF